MKNILLIVGITLSFGADAFGQFGDILKNADKIRKGAGAVRAISREFTEEEEIEIGRVVAARILATYPLSGNERLQTYVTLVGNTVAAFSTRPNLAWHFAVLDSSEVNAYSVPGGYIFITEGALRQIDSEAELAAVLGHEIAHATEKHILREIKRGNILTEGMSLVQDQYGKGGFTDEVGKKIGDIAIERLFKTGVGRKEELDSDRIGVDLAAAAGYRASAYLQFLEALQELATQNNSVFQRLSATHPKPDVRIKAVSPRLAKMTEGELLGERWQKWTTARKKS